MVINLNVVNSLRQVNNLGSYVSKGRVALLAASLKPGECVLYHNRDCSVTRRVTKHADGSTEVGMLSDDTMSTTLSHILNLCDLYAGTEKGRKLKTLAKKFLIANKKLLK